MGLLALRARPQDRGRTGELAEGAALLGVVSLTLDEALDAEPELPREAEMSLAAPLELVVDRERARVGAWYELFPRSFGWQQLANLRALYAYMWAHPGKKLLFMGGELAQEQEWSHDRSLDWHLLENAGHAIHVARASRQRLQLARLRALLRDRARTVVCACNFSPVVRTGYRLGLPRGGAWRTILDTDAAAYGGSNVGPGHSLQAEERSWHDQKWSAEVTLPPLGVLWLAPE